MIPIGDEYDPYATQDDLDERNNQTDPGGSVPVGAIRANRDGTFSRWDGVAWVPTELPAATDPRITGEVPVGDDTRGIEDGPGPSGPPGPAPANPGTLGGLGQPGTLTAPFTGTFTPPTPGGVPSWLPPVPGLTLPGFKAPSPFRATTREDVEADPGYAFARDEGLTGVQQSAAARGLLNSGGTLKDLAKWGTDFAATRYNDVDQRRRGDYLLDYQTQTLDPYRFAYQSALDVFAPKLTEWTTGASAAQHQNEGDYNNAWSQFLFDFDKFRDQRDSTWGKASQVLMA